MEIYILIIYAAMLIASPGIGFVRGNAGASEDKSKPHYICWLFIINILEEVKTFKMLRFQEIPSEEFHWPEKLWRCDFFRLPRFDIARIRAEVYSDKNYFLA